jgi:iron only hydrogenase large subunit-like protein
MEAIRVHDGKAMIMEERCIDCGECIRACPNHAKLAVTDTLDKLSSYEYKIAHPAPFLFRQFKDIKHIEDLPAFIELGFDDVFEVALAAEIVGYSIRQYLAAERYKRPLFSSACPATLRLMQIKFPDLLEQVVPFLTPMEVAARLAKDEAVKKTNLLMRRLGPFLSRLALQRLQR